MTKRRYFGNVRQRESGRWQVRYRGADGLLRSVPETFLRKSEAEAYLRELEVRIRRSDWVDPRLGRVQLAVYAEMWIEQRPGLRPRTVSIYQSLLNVYIRPSLGQVSMNRIDTPLIREWRASLLAGGASSLQVAKAYRLLHAVFETAVDEDRIVASNPCRIKGASAERSTERPILTVEQVFRLADLVPERWRAFVLLKTFGTMRWGEITALTRRDINLEASTVRIRRQHVELSNGRMELGPTKSRAGVRVVAIPPTVMAEVAAHLDRFSGAEPDAWVFAGENGQPLRRSNFNKAVEWQKIAAEIGVPNLHLHDLRHTGNTFAAATGASLRDLMARMGHDSPAAALIYQHATREADQVIARALEELLAASLGRASEVAVADAGNADDASGSGAS